MVRRLATGLTQVKVEALGAVEAHGRHNLTLAAVAGVGERRDVRVVQKVQNRGRRVLGSAQGVKLCRRRGGRAAV